MTYEDPDLATSQPEPPEIIRVRSRRVACAGAGGALGHPRVFMEMGEQGFVECGYCDRRFELIGDDEVAEDEALAPGAYEGAAGH
jgi:uncharacterized Zn-finger protein